MPKKTKKRASAASNSESVNFLKKAGILPPGENASSYPELRGNQQWNELHQHPEVQAKKEIIAEMIKAGKPELANAVAREE